MISQNDRVSSELSKSLSSPAGDHCSGNNRSELYASKHDSESRGRSARTPSYSSASMAAYFKIHHGDIMDHSDTTKTFPFSSTPPSNMILPIHFHAKASGSSKTQVSDLVRGQPKEPNSVREGEWRL